MTHFGAEPFEDPVVWVLSYLGRRNWHIELLGVNWSKKKERGMSLPWSCQLTSCKCSCQKQNVECKCNKAESLRCFPWQVPGFLSSSGTVLVIVSPSVKSSQRKCDLHFHSRAKSPGILCKVDCWHIRSMTASRFSCVQWVCKKCWLCKMLSGTCKALILPGPSGSTTPGLLSLN